MKTFFALLALTALVVTGCESTNDTTQAPVSGPTWPPPSPNTMNNPPPSSVNNPSAPATPSTPP